MTQIKSEKEYKAIMQRIDGLFFATDENTPQDDSRIVELDVLSALVGEYEKKAFPIEVPTLAATIESRMAEMHCTQKDIAAIICISAPCLSDIMNGGKILPISRHEPFQPNCQLARSSSWLYEPESCQRNRNLGQANP